MVIGIDGNEANVQEQVGVSVYTHNLLHQWQKKANENLQFLIYLRDKPKNILPKESEFFKYEIVKSEHLWSQVYLPFYLRTHNKPDVFFSPAHYSPRFLAAPLVVTVHDLSYFYYPDEFLKKDLYKLTNWTRYSVHKAKQIIAVSQNTKRDLIKFYNLKDNKIKVIYNGYEKQIKTSTYKTQNYLKNLQIAKGNYLLYVGTIQPRKNLNLLIRAFSKFKKDNSTFKLFVAGKKGWLYEKVFDLVENLKLTKDVIFVGHVSDEQLAYLYKNAFCFVLPSLYEGFGIPILEAMSYSCPVVSSNSSSLPEIGGNACLYFDPTYENQLVDKLTQLYENKNLRNQLIKKGQERIKFFSWQKCANQTLEILQNVVRL